MALGISTAFAADTVKIGVQAPITGEYANEGQGIEKAVRLLVEQKNAEGGLLGHKLEVVACDDEGKATQAALCGRQLVNEGVFAVVGSYTSGATAASQPIYARANVLHTSDGTAEQLTQRGYDLFFRNAPPNSAEAKFTAHYLVEHKGYDRIAVLSDHSSFSTNLGNSVIEEIKALGGNLVYTGFVNSGAQDFKAVLTKIKSENPDVLYFSGYYTDGGLIRAQMAELNMDAAFVGGNANQNVAFAKIAGDAATGSIVINVPPPANLPYPAAKQFLSEYETEYGEAPPSIYTLTNADGLRIIFHAVEETQSMDPQTVAEYMHAELEEFPGITGPISFDENGERLGSPFQALEVQADGTYESVYSRK